MPGVAGSPQTKGRRVLEVDVSVRWQSVVATLTVAASLGCVGAGASAAPQVHFSDLTGYSWAQGDIMTLAGQGILQGFPNGTFEPGAAVTRAQFAALLTRFFQLPQPTSQTVFPDVPSSYWAHAAIEAAAPYMETATADFEPNQPIERQDVAAAIVEVMIQQGKLPPLTGSEAEAAQAALGGVSDATMVSPALSLYVGEAIHRDIMLGLPNGAFEPDASLTRADAAVTLARLEQNFQIG